VNPERAACWARAQASHVLPTPVAPVIRTLCPWRSQSPPAREVTRLRSSPREARQSNVFEAGAGQLQLGGLEQPGEPLGVAPVDLALHQQRQPIVEGQLAGCRRCGLVGQGVDHAVQAQPAQLVQGVFIEQELLLRQW